MTFMYRTEYVVQELPLRAKTEKTVIWFDENVDTFLSGFGYDENVDFQVKIDCSILFH